MGELGEYTGKFIGAVIDQVLARQSGPEARTIIEKHGDFSIEGNSLMLVVEGVGQYVWKVNGGRIRYLGQMPAMTTCTVTVSEKTFWAIIRRHITPWEGVDHGEVIWRSTDGRTLYHMILLNDLFEEFRRAGGV